jgi:hypothetical protein
MTEPAPERSSRASEDYINLGRTALENHLETEKNKIPNASKLYRITDFITKRVWSWFYYYLDSRFGRNYPYSDYTDAPDKGIYRMVRSEDSSRDHVTIALCADWGTYTRESFHIAQRIGGHQPDYTIHLGDTYFVGEPKEIKRNFIDPQAPWIRGKVGSFAVLGNHEMYARGIAFFKDLLPTLGLKVNGHYQGQHAGFVCLENDHWRILALDTGYHSIGRIPLLEMVPGLGPDSRLDPLLIKWLMDDVRLGDPQDKRGLLILTHHQYVTAFNEGEYLVPARQLARLLGTHRPILWIWGHEHKFSMYEKVQIGQGVTAYGRCIGHGGMPVEVDHFKLKRNRHGRGKLVFCDRRIHRTQWHKKIPLGYNGYALVKIKANQLTIEYRDFFHLLVTERWQVSADGSLQGEIIPSSDIPLGPEPGKQWQDAVR